MRETERAGYEDGYGEAERHPKAALQHGRRRLEMRADRLQNIDRGVARIELRARGDHRMPAERERYVRHNAQRVVDVESIEHLLGRSAGAKLLRRPSVKRGAMLDARCLDRVKLRLGAPLEHVRTGAQRCDHRGDELVALGQGWAHRRRIFVERAPDDVHDPLTLDQQLDECPVATSRRDRTLAHDGICPPASCYRGSGGLLEAQEAAVVGWKSHTFDEIRDREQRSGRQACSS